MTMIEGEVYFDRSKDITKRAELQKERETLEKLEVNRPPGSGATPPTRPTERRPTHLDDADGGNQ
jgi:hypothetical protein